MDLWVDKWKWKEGQAINASTSGTSHSLQQHCLGGKYPTLFKQNILNLYPNKQLWKPSNKLFFKQNKHCRLYLFWPEFCIKIAWMLEGEKYIAIIGMSSILNSPVLNKVFPPSRKLLCEPYLRLHQKVFARVLCKKVSVTETTLITASNYKAFWGDRLPFLESDWHF